MEMVFGSYNAHIRVDRDARPTGAKEIRKSKSNLILTGQNIHEITQIV